MTHTTVPVEPTEEMIRAGQLGCTTSRTAAIYRAMIAAAPAIEREVSAPTAQAEELRLSNECLDMANAQVKSRNAELFAANALIVKKAKEIERLQEMLTVMRANEVSDLTKSIAKNATIAQQAEEIARLKDALRASCINDRAELASLKTLLANLVKVAPREVECDNMHHPKKFQHDAKETCPMVVQYGESLEAAIASIKERGK